MSFYSPYLQHTGYQGLESLRAQRQRAEALAAQRARRAQYLPLEDPDSGEEYSFGPRERVYLDARRRQEALENERRRREEEAQRYRQHLEELRQQEAARLRQAAELERNRREQARSRAQRFFTRGSTPADNVSIELFQVIRMLRRSPQHTPSHTQSAQEFDRTPHSTPRTSSNESSPQKTTPQQTPKTSAPGTAVPPTPEYTEVHNDAAQRIQQLYRQQRSLRSANHIASQFEEVRNSFTLPEAIDFINPTVSTTPTADESVITVDTTLPTSETSDSTFVNLDADRDVEVKVSGVEHGSSDATSPLVETSSDDQTTEYELLDSLPQSPAATTPSAGDPIDTNAQDEDPWTIIVPEQIETSPNSVDDSQPEMAMDDNESLGAVPETQTVLDDQTEVSADDHSADTSRTARLAYTKHNYPVHAYMEKLNVLLTKLDVVESHGSQKVRERRKEVARSIEKEAERIEALVRDIWRRHSQ